MGQSRIDASTGSTELLLFLAEDDETVALDELLFLAEDDETVATDELLLFAEEDETVATDELLFSAEEDEPFEEDDFAELELTLEEDISSLPPPDEQENVNTKASIMPATFANFVSSFFILLSPFQDANFG